MQRLRHDAQALTAFLVRHGAWIRARHVNVTGPGRIQATGEVHQAALASAGASDQRDVLACANAQGDAFQHEAIGDVAEDHILQLDQRLGFAPGLLHGMGGRCFLDRQRQDLEHALSPGQRALHGLPFLAQRRYRREETAKQQHEGRERADRNTPARQRALGACPQQAADDQRRQDGHQRRVDR